jgi:hypothetical protein
MMRSSSESSLFLTARLSDRGTALLFGLGALLLTAPFIYQFGLGDPDSTAIAVGVSQASLSGQGLYEPFLYAPEVHTLYYLVLLALVGRELPYDAIAQLMNLISWVANACNVMLLFCLLRRMCGTRGATLAAAALLTAPVYVDLSTYGHPITLATCVLLVGAVVLFRSRRSPRVPPAASPATLAFAWGLLTASLLIRGDGVLLFPGLLALVCYLADRKAVVLTGTLMLSATLVSLAVHHLMGASGHSSGIIQLYISLLTPDVHVIRRVLYGIPTLVAASGLGTLGLVIGSFVLSAWRRMIPVLCVATCFLVPGLLRGLVNPTPPIRHFYHFVVGGAVMLGFLFSRLPGSLGPRRLRALGTGVVALNLGLVVSLERLLPDGFIDRHVHHRLRPIMTSVFARQRTNERYHRWDEVRWNSLLRSATRDTLFVGSWCDLVGLRQAIARTGHHHAVLADRRWTEDKFVTFKAGETCLRFEEYYGYKPFRVPPTSHPIRQFMLLVDYPQDQFERFPRVIHYAPSASSWRF